MIPFLLGASWMAGTLALGALGAWIYSRARQGMAPIKIVDPGANELKSAFDRINSMEQQVKEIADEYSTRVGSVETKVNMLVAFRKTGDQK